MNAKQKFIVAMGIFGTVGIFVRYLSLSSAVIAFSRGLLGFLFLIAIMLLKRKKSALSAVVKKLPLLCLSGIALGGNWILLFEAYRYTTVATATVCYYLAPLFVLLTSPLFQERLTAKKLSCIIVAFLGLILVAGITPSSLPAAAELQGVLFGVGAAVLYAAVVLLNKGLSTIPSYDRTVSQLGISTLIILPYLLVSENTAILPLSASSIWLLLILGIVHTGVAYILYFHSIKSLPTQTTALLSYLDPALAIVLSSILFREIPSIPQIIGTVLILGSAIYSELPNKKAA